MKQKILAALGIYLFAGILAYGLNSHAEPDADVAPPRREAPATTAPRQVEAEPAEVDTEAPPEETVTPAPAPRRQQVGPRTQQKAPRRSEKTYRRTVLRCAAGTFQFFDFSPSRTCTDMSTGKKYDVRIDGAGFGASLEGSFVYIDTNGGRIEGSYGGLGVRYEIGIGGKAGVFAKGRSKLVLGGLGIGLNVSINARVVVTSVENRRARKQYRSYPDTDRDWVSRAFNMHY